MKAMKLVSSASLIIGAALSLAACGQSNKNATKSAKKSPEQMPQKTAKKGGTFKLDKNAKGFPFNLKKANQLLDKAGYKKKGKWRVQPNGKPLNIHFLTNLSTTTKLQTGLTESHF